jgi:hypothetical protein
MLVEYAARGRIETGKIVLVEYARSLAIVH